MSTLNPVFRSAAGVLFQGDCLDLLSALRSESVDMVFADPPFNLGKRYEGRSSDRMSQEDYLSWCRDWLSETVRALKPGGSLFVYNLPFWNIELGHFLASSCHLSFRHWIAISMKNCYPKSAHLYPAHYSLLYFTKGEPKAFYPDRVRYPMPLCRHCGKPIPDWGGHAKHLNPLGVNLSDVWGDLSPVRHRGVKFRPYGVNELPPRIPERAILLATDPGDVVLDPFGGGGGTYVVAETCGRRWIGCEIGECSGIVARLMSNGAVSISQDAPNRCLTDIFRGSTEPVDVMVASGGEEDA